MTRKVRWLDLQQVTDILGGRRCSEVMGSEVMGRGERGEETGWLVAGHGCDAIISKTLHRE